VSIVVYTALCGPKSQVQKPEWIRPDVDYVCFTDQPAETIPAPWQVYPLNKISKDPNRNAKQYKVLPHPVHPLRAYDINIWVDANFKITTGFDSVLPLLKTYDMVLFKHFERDCLYQEAEVCKAMGLDDPVLIDGQMARYRWFGFPEHYGMPECGTLIRRASFDSELLMNFWWREIEMGSRRDQLSFMYTVWMLGLRDQIKIMDYTARDGRHHVWTPHISMTPLPMDGQ
jgi:hypothetical protein